MDYVRVFDVELDRPVYYSGETLSGHVYLEVSENMRLQSVRSGADIDDQGLPCLSVLSVSEYVKLRQALVRSIDEALQTVNESLSLTSASASSFHFPVQH
ncbi:arrestin domain protein [Elysia marginata]|uniref:Arrestin domain protein n=1 Tax=Elysia marginata TaxID=1093978 RepID=A0AAV4I8W7_9GAST|nr:arrestin domain protein [Elysia marginata]